MRYLLIILTVMTCWPLQAGMAATYRFQPGDTIQISVWQDSKLDRQVVVAPDGTIALPLAGRIEAGGRSAGQVEKAIKARLSSQFKGQLDVTVNLSSLKQVPPGEQIDRLIFIMGEVNKPGEIVIKTRTTLLQALALGGGLSPFAADRRIQVHRKINGQDVIYKFDLRKFESGNNPEGNINLRPGDVVIVPERWFFE